MKHYPDTPEGFQQFLRDGPERSRLYRPGGEVSKESIVVRPERLKDGIANIEEVDWKKRAAADEWDGFEG